MLVHVVLSHVGPAVPYSKGLAIAGRSTERERTN
jgi:hypothetical protein